MDPDRGGPKNIHCGKVSRIQNIVWKKRLTSDDHLDGEDAVSGGGGGGDPVGDAAALVSDLGVQEGPLATGRLLFARRNYFPHQKCVIVRRLKVPKCEILDRSDFHYFYTIKPFWVDDFVVKILTYYFNFGGSQASVIFWCVSWAYA